MTASLPRFYPILDTATLRHRGLEVVAVAETLLEAGVRLLQYRHKEAWTQAEFDEAKQIAELARAAGALFVLNDRADFAAILNAGLHIGQTDLPAAAARSLVGKAVLGFSTHTRAQLARVSPEVDYVALGPIFKTKSKRNPDPEVGLEGLRELRALTQKPLVAIGGITIPRAAEVIEAGADSIATIGAWIPENADLAEIRTNVRDWLQL